MEEELDDKLDLLLSGQQYKKLQESYFGSVLQQYRLNIVDLRVLLFLHKHESCDTAKDIVRVHYLTKSYVSKAVDKLIERGFLERRQLTDDRRCVHLNILPAAQPCIDAVSQKKEEMRQQIFRGVTQEQLLVLKQIAAQMSRNIAEVLGKNVNM